MCGITFVHRKDKKEANKSIIKRYEKQKHRGSEGFGYIAINNGKLVSYKRAKLESQIKTFIEQEKANTILFHHRYPTSTPNFKESAHPIKVSSIDLKYDYYLAHNGIISNADDLKEKHEKLGFSYNTEITKKFFTTGSTYKETMFNDSEALAIDVALAIDKNKMSIEARGSIAFIVAQVHKSTNKIVAIWYARNEGSPLKVNMGKDFISIGSESEGKLVSTEKIIHKLDLDSMKVSQFYFDMPSYIVYTPRMGYTDYNSYNNTTFGDDNIISWGDEINDLEDEEMSLDQEINMLETQIKIAQENDDGSPESQNALIEMEEQLINLYNELDYTQQKMFDSVVDSIPSKKGKKGKNKK